MLLDGPFDSTIERSESNFCFLTGYLCSTFSYKLEPNLSFKKLAPKNSRGKHLLMLSLENSAYNIFDRW